MHVQGAILQSQDFNLQAECARKFLIHEANISKTDPGTLLLHAKNYSTLKAECICNIVKKFWSRTPPTWKFPFFSNLSKIYDSLSP